MANTLTGLIPDLYNAAEIVSRELTGFIPAVRVDTGTAGGVDDVNASVARAGQGQNVTIPLTQAQAPRDVTPGVTAPDSGDQTIDNVQITISKSRAVDVRWNGEESRRYGHTGLMANTFTNQVAQAMRSLVNEMEADLGLEISQNASRAYGTAGTTPFGTPNDLSDFAGVAKILKDNGAPLSDLQLVYDTTAGASLAGKQSVLFKVNEAGTDEFLRNGMAGRVQGMALRESGGVATHTPGAASGYTVTGAEAVGSKLIETSTGTGNFEPGDIVDFADGEQYVVNAQSTDVNITTPGLVLALSGGEAVSSAAAHVANAAFDRQAVILAVRAPALPNNLQGQPSDMATDRIMVTDDVTGLMFEISVYEQYKQILFEVAAAWGQRVIQPEHVALLLG